jgi:hypothetical protein
VVRRSPRTLVAIAIGVALLVNACGYPPAPLPEPAAGSGRAFGQWSPAGIDTCPKDLHDRYAVIGQNGKRYPTWHPAQITNPATGQLCSFGHEHGRDPAESDLWSWIQEKQAYNGEVEHAGLAFGITTEALTEWSAAEAAVGRTAVGDRFEDHVGHKVEWQNDVALERSAIGGRVPIGVTCDWLTKIHQGTHSPDALTENLHELQYFVRCSDGTEIAAITFSAVGAPGQFVRSCDKTTIVTPGGPTTANSPTGGGVRFIPDRTCINRWFLVAQGQYSDVSRAIYEDWITANYLRTPDGDWLAYYDPHFAVFNPSRFNEPGAAGRIGRVVHACGETEANGDRARNGICDAATDHGANPPVPWNDPQAGFDGATRETYFNQTSIDNAGGATTWYTDPFGGNARTTPFPGSIRQYICSLDNRSRPTLESQAFGGDRSYAGPTVHAPN